MSERSRTEASLTPISGVDQADIDRKDRTEAYYSRIEQKIEEVSPMLAVIEREAVAPYDIFCRRLDTAFATLLEKYPPASVETAHRYLQSLQEVNALYPAGFDEDADFDLDEADYQRGEQCLEAMDEIEKHNDSDVLYLVEIWKVFDRAKQRKQEADLFQDPAYASETIPSIISEYLQCDVADISQDDYQYTVEGLSVNVILNGYLDALMKEQDMLGGHVPNTPVVLLEASFDRYTKKHEQLHNYAGLLTDRYFYLERARAAAERIADSDARLQSHTYETEYGKEMDQNAKESNEMILLAALDQLFNYCGEEIVVALDIFADQKPDVNQLFAHFDRYFIEEYYRILPDSQFADDALGNRLPSYEDRAKLFIASVSLLIKSDRHDYLVGLFALFEPLKASRWSEVTSRLFGRAALDHEVEQIDQGLLDDQRLNEYMLR